VPKLFKKILPKDTNHCLNCYFFRLVQTRAKALQTVSRFSKEKRRRFSAPESNAVALVVKNAKLYNDKMLCNNPGTIRFIMAVCIFFLLIGAVS